MTPAIRVALAEDHALVRDGLTRLVQAEADLELVGVASDLPDLLALVEREDPDVVVTDIRMPPTRVDEGIQAAAWLRAHKPETGVVVLSQYATPGLALALLGDGSAGRAYLLKERVAGAAELAGAIRTVADGGSVIDAAKMMKLKYESPAADFDELGSPFLDLRKRVIQFPTEKVNHARLVAISTTSGTGSEITPFAVLFDNERGRKVTLADYSLSPDVAIVDPQFVMSMPKGLTADTGVAPWLRRWL